MLTPCHAEEVTFATGKYPPFITAMGSPPGITTQFINKACELAGITPKYEFFSWSRAAHSVELGKYFGSFPWRINEERKQRFQFSNEVVSQDSTAVFYLKDDHIKIPEWENYTELKEYGIIGIKSYWYEAKFIKLDSRAYLARDSA